MDESKLLENLIGMYEARGYTNIDRTLKKIALPGNYVTGITAKTEIGKPVIAFWMLMRASFGKAEMLEFIATLKASYTTPAHITIVCDSVTDMSVELIGKQKRSSRLNMEVITTKDIFVIKTRYHMVPTYELLEAKQVEELLQRHKCKLEHLPKMNAGDAMARFLYLLKGDVVRVTEKSTLKMVTYRLVC